MGVSLSDIGNWIATHNLFARLSQDQPLPQGQPGSAVPMDPSVPMYSGDGLNGPQGPNESNLAYGARKLLRAPLNVAADIFNGDWLTQGRFSPFNPNNAPGQDIRQAMHYAAATPASAHTAPASQNLATGSNVFPNSFRDPTYDQADQIAAQQFGVPVDVLRSIRLNGERSNANQVSSKGARSPYQIIPQTRQGIINNYGFDPLSSPLNAARGAAAVLAEGYKRTGTWQGAVQQYVGGSGPASPQNQAIRDAYTQRVLGGQTGLPAPFVNPFNPAYGQDAIAALDQGQQQALQPQSETLNRAPAPTLAPPQAIPQTDFSEANAQMQQAEPTPVTPAEAAGLRRANIFSGIGQALASLPEGAGLGHVLGALGGGALAGRGKADQMIFEESRRFDDEMMKYHMAVANNDMSEAEVHSREAQFNVQQMNNYAQKQFEVGYNQWAKDNNVTVTPDSIVTSKTDPNGNVVVNRTPLRGVINATFAVHRASVYSTMMGGQTQGNAMVASAANGILSMETARTLNQQGSQTDPLTAVAPLASAATAVVENGRSMDVLGDQQAYGQLRSNINGQMTTDGWHEPTLTDPPQYAAQYREEFQKRLAEHFVVGAMSDPTGKFRARLFGAAIPGLAMQRAQQSAHMATKTTVDAHGRQTTSTTVSGTADAE